MTELKPISHKEFNAYIKGKGFKGRNDYALKDLKAKFGFKPKVTFLGVGHMIIRYARKNGRDTFKRSFDGKVFSVNC